MAAPFPHHYDVHLIAGDRSTGLLTSEGRSGILAGAPPQFDGLPGRWSPEHLLLSSVALCLMTTYQALAGRMKLPIVRYESQAEGVLDKTAAGLAFTSVVVSVDLVVNAEDRERAERLVETAKRHCIVSNALKPEVTVRAKVRSAVAVPA